MPKILAIGGGKGGIGKSFFSAHFGLGLSNIGCRVALVDLDLGAANLHTCLGIASPKQGLAEFFLGRVENLETLSVPTGFSGLDIFSGGQEFWQQVRPQPAQKMKLISKLQSLPYDYIILDLGAGTHVNTLDFFLYSHIGILVVLPEPTSIENAYVFLKSALYRKVQNIIKALQCEDAAQTLLTALTDTRIAHPPFAQIENFSQQNKQLGQRIMQLITNTKLEIVMNQVRTQGDIDLGASMTHISKQFFGFNASSLGSLPYDDAVWKAVRSRKCLLSHDPECEAWKAIAGLAHKSHEKWSTNT